MRSKTVTAKAVGAAISRAFFSTYQKQVTFTWNSKRKVFLIGGPDATEVYLRLKGKLIPNECDKCDGTGKTSPHTCLHCCGTGKTPALQGCRNVTTKVEK